MKVIILSVIISFSSWKSICANKNEDAKNFFARDILLKEPLKFDVLTRYGLEPFDTKPQNFAGLENDNELHSVLKSAVSQNESEIFSSTSNNSADVGVKMARRQDFKGDQDLMGTRSREYVNENRRLNDDNSNVISGQDDNDIDYDEKSPKATRRNDKLSDSVDNENSNVQINNAGKSKAIRESVIPRKSKRKIKIKVTRINSHRSKPDQGSGQIFQDNGDIEQEFNTNKDIPKQLEILVHQAQEKSNQPKQESKGGYYYEGEKDVDVQKSKVGLDNVRNVIIQGKSVELNKEGNIDQDLNSFIINRDIHLTTDRPVLLENQHAESAKEVIHSPLNLMRDEGVFKPSNIENSIRVKTAERKDQNFNNLEANSRRESLVDLLLHLMEQKEPVASKNDNQYLHSSQKGYVILPNRAISPENGNQHMEGLLTEYLLLPNQPIAPEYGNQYIKSSKKEYLTLPNKPIPHEYGDQYFENSIQGFSNVAKPVMANNEVFADEILRTSEGMSTRRSAYVLPSNDMRELLQYGNRHPEGKVQGVARIASNPMIGSSSVNANSVKNSGYLMSNSRSGIDDGNNVEVHSSSYVIPSQEPALHEPFYLKEPQDVLRGNAHHQIYKTISEADSISSSNEDTTLESTYAQPLIQSHRPILPEYGNQDLQNLTSNSHLPRQLILTRETPMPEYNIQHLKRPVKEDNFSNHKYFDSEDLHRTLASVQNRVGDRIPDEPESEIDWRRSKGPDFSNEESYLETLKTIVKNLYDNLGKIKKGPPNINIGEIINYLRPVLYQFEYVSNLKIPTLRSVVSRLGPDVIENNESGYINKVVPEKLPVISSRLYKPTEVELQESFNQLNSVEPELPTHPRRHKPLKLESSETVYQANSDEPKLPIPSWNEQSTLQPEVFDQRLHFREPFKLKTRRIFHHGHVKKPTDFYWHKSVELKPHPISIHFSEHKSTASEILKSLNQLGPRTHGVNAGVFPNILTDWKKRNSQFNDFKLDKPETVVLNIRQGLQPAETFDQVEPVKPINLNWDKSVELKPQEVPEHGPRYLEPVELKAQATYDQTDKKEFSDTYRWHKPANYGAHNMGTKDTYNPQMTFQLIHQNIPTEVYLEKRSSQGDAGLNTANSVLLEKPNISTWHEIAKPETFDQSGPSEIQLPSLRHPSGTGTQSEELVLETSHPQNQPPSIDVLRHVIEHLIDVNSFNLKIAQELLLKVLRQLIIYLKENQVPKSIIEELIQRMIKNVMYMLDEYAAKCTARELYVNFALELESSVSQYLSEADTSNSLALQDNTRVTEEYLINVLRSPKLETILKNIIETHLQMMTV